MTLLETFRETIREELRKRDWTQGKLAEHLQISEAVVSSMLRHNNVSLERVERVGLALGITFKLVPVYEDNWRKYVKIK
jgi:predicted transcriptional regulator